MSMVPDCNQSTFKSKKEQILILCSNNGKLVNSVALSQIMVKIKSNILLLSMVVCNKKTRLQTFHFTSERVPSTLALPSVPDLQLPNLFVIAFFVVNYSLKLLSKQHPAKTSTQKSNRGTNHLQLYQILPLPR